MDTYSCVLNGIYCAKVSLSEEEEEGTGALGEGHDQWEDAYENRARMCERLLQQMGICCDGWPCDT